MTLLMTKIALLYTARRKTVEDLRDDNTSTRMIPVKPQNKKTVSVELLLHMEIYVCMCCEGRNKKRLI